MYDQPGWYLTGPEQDLTTLGKALYRGAGAVGTGLPLAAAGAGLASALDKDPWMGAAIGGGVGALAGGIAATPPRIQQIYKAQDADAIRQSLQAMGEVDTESFEDYFQSDYKPGLHAYVGPMNEEGTARQYQVRHVPEFRKGASMTPYEAGYLYTMKLAGLMGQIGHTLTAPVRLAGNIAGEATWRGLRRANKALGISDDSARHVIEEAVGPGQADEFADMLRGIGVDTSGSLDDWASSALRANRQNMKGNAARTVGLGAAAYGGKKLYDQQAQSAPERMWNRFVG